MAVGKKIGFLDRILNRIADRIYVRIEERISKAPTCPINEAQEVLPTNPDGTIKVGWKNPQGIKVLKSDDLGIDKRKIREKEAKENSLQHEQV